MKSHGKTTTPGIDLRHRRGCPSHVGELCACQPTYQAHVYSAREQKRIRRTFSNLAEARSWRRDALTALERGTMKAPSKVTLRQASMTWLTAAQDGTIRNRSGNLYKPSVLRGYEQSLRLRILPELGALRLTEVRRFDLQSLIERMQQSGCNPSTIRNALMPLRRIYHRAALRGDVVINPTQGLELPAVRGVRDRIASGPEAAALIAALAEPDRTLWATALFTGLRLGELRALAWEHVDLTAGLIRVERSWDPKAGFVEPKSRAGGRVVPIPAALRHFLLEHRVRQEPARDLVFTNGPGRPFDPATINARAAKAWERAGLRRIGMHECRHTFASLMIAAGVNAKALSSYLGHASVTITFDRYGHLMPGNEAEAAELLDSYLARAGEAADAKA